MFRKTFLSVLVLIMVTITNATFHRPARAQDIPHAHTTLKLNLRAGPGDDHAVIAILPTGTHVIIEARADGGRWLLVHTAEGAAISARGWVWAAYLVLADGADIGALPVSTEQVNTPPTSPSPTAPPETLGAGTVSTTTRLNLRTGPGVNYTIITTLAAGARMEVEAYSKDGTWAKVHTEDGSTWGWAAARFLIDAAFVDAPPPPIVSIGSRVRAIYTHGQTLGNNPYRFSRLGDCNSRNPFFLMPFDTGAYNLGQYAYLQPAIEHFRGAFAREGQAVFGSGSAWAVLDSTWSDPAYCHAKETPIACEYRINRPSIFLISFGTHDDPSRFADDLRAIIDFSIAHGVIPILGTKADWVNDNNVIIAQVAAEYDLPLWDFGTAAQALPNHGVREDGARLSYFFPLDYANPQARATGHTLRNLMALQILDAVWRGAMQ